MTTKSKAPVASDPNALTLTGKADDTVAQASSKALAKPNLAAAMVTHAFGKSMMGQADVTTMLTSVASSADAVVGGDLSAAEAMLCSQAIALNTIFGDLAVRANLNRSDYPLAFDRYMKVALKAQAQCRATLETLATIKNPPVVYARQANVTSGPQQVNNYCADNAHAPARGQKNPDTPDELLEGQSGGA